MTNLDLTKFRNLIETLFADDFAILVNDQIGTYKVRSLVKTILTIEPTFAYLCMT